MTLSSRDFLRDDSGAITVDWVTLTAGLLLFGIAIIFAIFDGGVDPLVNNMSTTLSNVVLPASIDQGALVEDLTTID